MFVLALFLALPANSTNETLYEYQSLVSWSLKVSYLAAHRRVLPGHSDDLKLQCCAALMR